MNKFAVCINSVYLLLSSMASLSTAELATWKLTKHQHNPDTTLSIHTFRAVSETAKDFDCTLIIINPKKVRAELIVNKTQEPEREASKQARASKAIAGINGGYFDANFETVGLLKSKGHILQKPSSTPPLSGLIGINNKYQVRIQKGADHTSFENAIQSGPLLIEMDGTKGINSNNGNYAKRSLIGMSGKGDIILVHTGHVSLYELCLFLHQQQKELSIDGLHSVINLDGGPSSGIFAQNAHKTIITNAHKACKTNLLFFQKEEKDSPE